MHICEYCIDRKESSQQPPIERTQNIRRKQFTICNLNWGKTSVKVVRGIGRRCSFEDWCHRYKTIQQRGGHDQKHSYREGRVTSKPYKKIRRQP